MNDLAWQKSSCSSVAGRNCAEVAPLPGGGRAVRDSKAPAAACSCCPRAVADNAAGPGAFPCKQFRAGKLARSREPAEEGPPDGFRVVAVRVVACPGDPRETDVRIRRRHGVAVGAGDGSAGRRVAADHQRGHRQRPRRVPQVRV